MHKYRVRRTIGLLLTLVIGWLIINIDTLPEQPTETAPPVLLDKPTPNTNTNSGDLAINLLRKLDTKGRAPKTNYSRDQFGPGWGSKLGCDTRNIILNRDLTDVKYDSNCRVVSGRLHDPYTGKIINFQRGPDTSPLVQIDHVVALSDAWQKGAQGLSPEKRVAFSNDPLNLLAVDGPSNQEKSNSDASGWLPPNKAFRCQYVSRQVAVKHKYGLWVTPAEARAIETILGGCPDQRVPN